MFCHRRTRARTLFTFDSFIVFAICEANVERKPEFVSIFNFGWSCLANRFSLRCVSVQNVDRRNDDDVRKKLNEQIKKSSTAENSCILTPSLILIHIIRLIRSNIFMWFVFFERKIPKSQRALDVLPNVAKVLRCLVRLANCFCDSWKKGLLNATKK